MLEFQFRYLISFSSGDLSAMGTCFMSHLLVLVSRARLGLLLVLALLVLVLVLIQVVLTTTL